VTKKWYSYFVVSDEPTTAASPVSDTPPRPERAPRRAADLAPDAPPAAPPPPDASPAADLSIVYDSARIAPPAHGYTVLKVAEMLQSEHIRSLPAEVRRKSVLVALDAAGVKVEEIVEDAVRRDRALDTFERVLQQRADQLAATTAADNERIEAEIAARVAELRARIDENTRKVAAEQAELRAWRARKQAEESLIAEAVGHFVSENPITAAPGAAEHQGDADVR
jgi:Asp-tRNA(Asn)/Glu-tRNA(Gln) amidotransferase A subunit family amidase